MKKRITLERTYRASIEDVWELWTTKDGIESWWGPDGFAVTVSKIDVRVGGELHYAMAAIEADKIAFMEKAGMPTVTEHVIRYTEVARNERLAYLHPVDFVPGVTAYDVETRVELSSTAAGVRMALTIDAMHDELWTQRAVAGWEMELGKLEARLTKVRGSKIAPCLWFDGQAEEAARFYASLFADGAIGAIARYGEGMPFPAGTAMMVEFTLAGQRFQALNGGPQYKFTEAISLSVRCADQAEVDRLWDALTTGGKESQCGWLVDRYGVSWQLVPDAFVELQRTGKGPGIGRMFQAMMGMKKLDVAALEKAYRGD